MLHKQIITAYTANTKHVNSLCGNYVEFSNTKPGNICHNKYALKLTALGYLSVYLVMLQLERLQSYQREIQIS
jgi:hypothetical protein